MYARDVLAKLNATLVIRYNQQGKYFQGFTEKFPGDGFEIEGGRGYIVNTRESQIVPFSGIAWANQPSKTFSTAPSNLFEGNTWAFMVTVDPGSMSNLNFSVKNQRTGNLAHISQPDSDSIQQAIWADWSRQPIVEVGDLIEISIHDQFQVLEKCLRTVQMAYARAPYYAQYALLIEEYFKDPDPSLINRNMRFIRAVMEILDIRTRIITSSSLGITSKNTQLLVDLLKEIGADTYLCGDGAYGYQQDKLFSDNGIILEYNRLMHPKYRQLRAEQFVPGLSMLNALFNVSLSQLTRWIHNS